MNILDCHDYLIKTRKIKLFDSTIIVSPLPPNSPYPSPTSERPHSPLPHWRAYPGPHAKAVPWTSVRGGLSRNQQAHSHDKRERIHWVYRRTRGGVGACWSSHPTFLTFTASQPLFSNLIFGESFPPENLRNIRTSDRETQTLKIKNRTVGFRNNRIDFSLFK